MRLPPPLVRVVQVSALLLPILALLIVWVPEFRHYSIPDTRIDPAAVASARLTPPDTLLQELRDFYLFPRDSRQPELETAVAERMLEGRLEIPGVQPTTFSLRFTPTDFDSLAPSPRLWFAELVVADYLLAAYQNTGREEFFTAARDFLLAWGEYERQAWLPNRMLWNDHATAARVRVVGEFWRHYRARPDYDSAVGRAVLQQAARYGEYLLAPEQFTYSTNHGIMENVGLLHLSLAFPTLPRSAEYQRVALDRLHQQMGFFIDSAGVIREHSAGYQAFGLELLGMAFRCLTLLNEPIPEAWAIKYARGLRFFAQLRRPDGTLPAYGDTDGASQNVIPRVVEIDAQGRAGVRHYREQWKAHEQTALHPGAGYWVDWSGFDDRPDAGSLQQTVVTWTRRPPEAHKHADELTVLVWADGVSWLTNVGYWPYLTPGREDAESWPASNAPHMAGESTESRRTARLIASARSRRMAVIDVERAGPESFHARRQVIHVEPDVWVILDDVRGPAEHKTRTVWTLSPEVSIQNRDAHWYTLRAARSGATAQLGFLASQGTTITDHRGSHAPFAGWHVEHWEPRPTNAIVVEQPAGDSRLAVILSRRAFDGMPRLERGTDPEWWTLTLATDAGPIELARQDNQVRVTGGKGRGRGADTLHLRPAAAGANDDGAIREAYARSAEQYPRFVNHGPRRMKVTYLIMLLIVGQEMVLWVARRAVRSWYAPLRVTSVVCWVAVAVWLQCFFLRSWVVLAP